MSDDQRPICTGNFLATSELCTQCGRTSDEHDDDDPELRWNDDAIQFPRLLAEIMGCVDFTTKQREALEIEMDLDWDEITELFERAQIAWEGIKERAR